MKVRAEELDSVYQELQRVADQLLRREQFPGLLQTIDLVNEAYLRLHDVRSSFENAAHFKAVASRAMRRILIDQARQRRAQKREGALVELKELDDAGVRVQPDLDGYLAVDRALRRLGREDVRLAEVIELRFFGGLTTEEIALALGLSEKTVKRIWAQARDRLAQEFGRR